MLNAISRRINRKDEGFTLIELMVVLVVIGILMAIAIPTFLGAKNKANDRSAEENARNALTAEKEYYTDNQAYLAASASTANPAILSSLEPVLNWVTAATTSTSGNPVYTIATAVNSATVMDNIFIEVPSASGGCVYLDDEALTPGAVAADTLPAGTYYASSTAACGTEAPAVPLTVGAVNVGTKQTPGNSTTAPKFGASW